EADAGSLHAGIRGPWAPGGPASCPARAFRLNSFSKKSLAPFLKIHIFGHTFFTRLDAGSGKGKVVEILNFLLTPASKLLKCSRCQWQHRLKKSEKTLLTVGAIGIC